MLPDLLKSDPYRAHSPSISSLLQYRTIFVSRHTNGRTDESLSCSPGIASKVVPGSWSDAEKVGHQRGSLLSHLIRGPAMHFMVSNDKPSRYLGHCTHQQIAVLGAMLIIRGTMPRQYPAAPSRRYTRRAAFQIPEQFRILGSPLLPLVWSKVLTTSRGVVAAAPNAPASPPTKQCENGSYLPVGLRIFEKDSYTVNWMAAKGMFIEMVAG